MRIYQAADGRWILWTGSEKIYFDTQMEALEAMAKIDLAKAIVYQAQRLALVMDEGPDVLQEYFDSGVTFTDDDVAALGVTAAQVTACTTLLENVGKFFGGTDPVNAVYRTTVNAVQRAVTG